VCGRLLVPMLKSDMTCYCIGFKVCNNCSNIVIHLGDQLTTPLYFTIVFVSVYILCIYIFIYIYADLFIPLSYKIGFLLSSNLQNMNTFFSVPAF
jgi:hypothetical protein